MEISYFYSFYWSDNLDFDHAYLTIIKLINTMIRELINTISDKNRMNFFL